MREIKFRVWVQEQEQMLVGGRADRNLLTFDGEIMLHNGIDGYIKPGNCILMQYTGLRDKNGKEIYEGDVVFIKSFKPEIYEVVFDRGCFCLKSGDDSNFYPDIKYAEDDRSEVIGNKYQNPELLKAN